VHFVSKGITVAKMGRPPKIDLKQLRSFMRLKPTLKDCADFFECDTSTVEVTIKRNFGITFTEFRAQNMVKCRHNLVRKAIQMGEDGNVPMLIFSLKNLCGWKDKHEVSSEEDKPFRLAYDPTFTPDK
jgi:hypothetical protein